MLRRRGQDEHNAGIQHDNSDVHRIIHRRGKINHNPKDEIRRRCGTDGGAGAARHTGKHAEFDHSGTNPIPSGANTKVTTRSLRQAPGTSCLTILLPRNRPLVRRPHLHGWNGDILDDGEGGGAVEY